MPYKIVEFDGNYSIQKDSMSIPRSTSNRHYNQFIEDIALGNDTVEGPDVYEQSYAELRQSEYPSMADQMDMQYHDNINGTTVWADTIQAIKDKYPKTITGGVTVGDVPSWVQEEADEWLFQKQLAEYQKAVARLAQYPLEEGREEVREMQPTGEQIFNEETEQMEDVMAEVVVVSAIDPVEPTIEQTVYGDDPMAEPTIETIENPLITKDNAERVAAQAIVDATPIEVKDVTQTP